MELFFSLLSALIFGAASLVIGVSNPIHSLLILIFVFFLGSLLLFFMQLEYFALLFLIVYVGAIVVLFLFVVMMLEIKTFGVAQRFRDLFSYRSWILVFFALEFLFFFSQSAFDIFPLLALTEEQTGLLAFREINLSVDYSTLIQKTDHLRGFGGVLFTEYKLAILVAALLLLVSMIGSIVMTLDNSAYTNLRTQDANIQSLRQPAYLINSWRNVTTN